MKAVMTLIVRDEGDVLDPLLAFHLHAGIDHVIVCDLAFDDEVRAILAEYEREGVVSIIRMNGGASGGEPRARMRTMATELGATWLVEGDADEFWWPRGTSFEEVLDPIPPRYTAVQALVRVFPPLLEGAPFFADRMTFRDGLAGEHPDPEPLPWALRPVYRVRGDRILRVSDSGSVPLRAWYPLEVLRFPLREADQARRFADDRSRAPRSRLEAAFLDRTKEGIAHAYEGVAVGGGAADLSGDVEDVRLRDALRELITDADPIRSFLPTRPGTPALAVPTIVDEAIHAVECAAVGEVDLVALDRHIRELEARIALLEQRFWPRVLRKASRLARGRIRRPS